MTDRDGPNLALLAPEVDEERSRELFDRQRGRRRARRRAGMAVSAVTLVVVAVVGVRAWNNDGGTVDVETGFVDQPGGDVEDSPDFDVLDVRQARDPMGTLRAAVDAVALAALWSTAGYEDDPPSVDFDQWVLVTITIPDDACPPTLSGFDRAGSVLTPVFVEPEGAATSPSFPRRSSWLSSDRR